MKSLILSTFVLALGTVPSLSAQTVAEIPAMTLPSSSLNMGAMTAGLTNTARLNAAGTNGGLCFCEITARPKTTAAVGIYNTNAACAANGLGGDPSVATGQDPQPLFLTPAPTGAFNAVSFRLVLAKSCTEIGIGIGDWVGGAALRFLSNGVLQTTFTSTSYSTTSCVKFFQMTAGTFDSVELDVTTTGGNFVITELWTEQCGANMQSFGSGCAGLLGVPTITPGSTPSPGGVLIVNVANTPGAWFMVAGSSGYSDPLLGRLPFDLSNFGASGCSLLCTLDLFTAAGAGGGFALPIPPGISGCICMQVIAADSTANPLGLTTSNGLEVFIR